MDKYNPNPAPTPRALRWQELVLMLMAFLALWLFPWPLVLLSVVWAVSTSISRGAKVSLRLSFLRGELELSGEPGAVTAPP